MPGGKCTICAHPQRGEAEQAIAGGESVRSVAKRLALSYQSLDRHQRNCARQAIAKAVETRQVASGAAIVDRMEDLQSQTLELVHEARHGRVIQMPDPKEPGKTKPLFIPPDPTEARLAISTGRKNLELIARLRGELQPKEDVGRQTVTFEEFELIYRRTQVAA